jgi:hypothetical protein
MFIDYQTLLMHQACQAAPGSTTAMYFIDLSRFLNGIYVREKTRQRGNLRPDPVAGECQSGSQGRWRGRIGKLPF